MNRLLLILACCLLSLSTALAQPCPEYAQLIKAGNQYRHEKKYKLALNKFNAAKLCQPDSSNQIDQRISAVFDAIEEEKNEAIRQKGIATQAQKQAFAEASKAKLAEAEAKKAKNDAVAAQKDAVEAKNDAVAAAETAKKAQKQAQKDARKAQALLWANESDNMPLDSAIRQLVKAAEFNLNEVPLYERLFQRFNSDSLVAKQLSLPYKPMTTLGHRGPVYSAVFSGDGSRLLTASEDSTAKLWDEKGQLVATLAHRGPVRSAVFSGYCL